MSIRELPCRCCGENVMTFDGHPIHTLCIPKHWTKHVKARNASRCKEFSDRAKARKVKS